MTRVNAGETALEFAAASGAALTVQEEDGTPIDTAVTIIRVPNAGLVDNGAGDVSLGYELAGAVTTHAGGADPHTVYGALAQAETWAALQTFGAGLKLVDTDGSPVGDILLRNIDETLEARNAADAAFVPATVLKLYLGGKTVGDILLKLFSGPLFQVRKGDDSAYAPITGSTILGDTKLQSDSYDPATSGQPPNFPEGFRTAEEAKTISAGILIPTKGMVRVLGQGGAADDLDTIAGLVHDGTRLLLRASDTAVTITLKHNTGNILTVTGADIALDDDVKMALCVYSATLAKWIACLIGVTDGPASGDLTGSYPAPTIGADKVTYAKMQNVSATDRLLGRDTAAAGDVEEIPLSTGLEFTGGPGVRVKVADLSSVHQYVWGNDEAEDADVTTGVLTRMHSTGPTAEPCTRITVHAETSPASGNLVFTIQESSAEDLNGATWSTVQTVTFVATGADPDTHIVTAPAFSFTARRAVRINITTAPAGWKDISIIAEIKRQLVTTA